MPYIPFTDEQKQRANSVDLVEFLLRRGERLLPFGRDKQLDSDHSVTIRGCEWFDHAVPVGGRAISFVQRQYGLSYQEAVKLLLNGEDGAGYPTANEEENLSPSPFVLPPRNQYMRRLFAYLMERRGIDRSTVMDDETGIALYGSKNIYVRKRAKGTERSDLANQDEGVKMFFGDEPTMEMRDEPIQVDLAIMPCIDGWFKTEVKQMGQFEAAYQSYHSMMNFFGMNQLLSGGDGLVMPIIDEEDRRQARGAFCAKYAAGRPYFMVRAKTPQLVLDEIDKLMEQLGMN